METGIHELTAGYALDALDQDERRAYEAHLPTCASCQLELESLWETSAALAVAASGPAPGSGLRDRILAEVRAEPPQNVVPFEARRRRAAPVLAVAAVAAAVIALAVGVWAASLSSDLDDTRSALHRANAVAAVLADPDARSVPLSEGNGRLVVDSDGQAVLVVDDLDPAPAGKTYEMWVASEGQDPQPAGLFQGQDGRDVVPVDGTVEPGQVVLVTVEDAAGVDAPTTEPILGSQPA
jgi:anti-sigma-K factor RskA